MHSEYALLKLYPKPPDIRLSIIYMVGFWVFVLLYASMTSVATLFDPIATPSIEPGDFTAKLISIVEKFKLSILLSAVAIVAPRFNAIHEIKYKIDSLQSIPCLPNSVRRFVQLDLELTRHHDSCLFIAGLFGIGLAAIIATRIVLQLQPPHHQLLFEYCCVVSLTVYYYIQIQRISVSSTFVTSLRHLDQVASIKT
jgi:hypothetical protein